MLLFKNIVLTLLLIWASYTDIKRQEIDHEPIIIGLVFIVLFSLCGFNNVSVKSSILGFLIGGITFLIISFWGMGGGDIKLMALIGFFVGWKHTILIMYISFLIGSIVGIIIVLTKKKTMKEHIPFGPSISAATLFVLIYGAQIINKYEFLWFLR